MNTFTVKAYGAESTTADLKEMNIDRRAVTASDIEIEILYCGVCHSDLHTVRNDWGGSQYPVVPGHEIVGRVTAVGSEVSKLKVGDLAAVGCMVDSCRTCDSCKQDLEQYCINGFTGTYNGKDKHLSGHTFGGYSQKVVVDEHFVLKVPENQRSTLDKVLATLFHLQDSEDISETIKLQIKRKHNPFNRAARLLRYLKCDNESTKVQSFGEKL